MLSAIKKFFIIGFLSVVIISYLFCIYHIVFDRAEVDLLLFYCSAKNFWQHHSIYSAVMTTPIHFHQTHAIDPYLVNYQVTIYKLGTYYLKNLNSPVFTLFFSPLGLLSYTLAASIWQGLILLSSIIALRFLYVIFFQQGTIWGYLVLLGLYLASAPAYENIITSEVGSLVFFIITVVWFYARKAEDLKAGVLLGILLSIKYFFGLIWLLFFLQRRWRLIFSAMVSFFLLNGVAIIFCGKESFVQYYQIIHSVSWFFHPWNASLYGFLYKIHPTVIQHKILITPCAKQFYWMAVGIMIVYQIFLAKRKFINESEFDYAFSYTLLITLLISPLAWVYYFPILLLPILVILRNFSNILLTMPRILSYSLMLALLIIPMNLTALLHPLSPRSYPLIYTAFFFGLLLLLLVFFGCHKKIQPSFIDKTKIFPWLILSYVPVLFSFSVLFEHTFISASKIWD